MKVVVLCCGKLREAYFKQAAEEYRKRLSRFFDIAIEEVPDLPEPANASPADLRQIIEREGKALLRRVAPQDFVVALCVEGAAPDSPGFSRMLEDWLARGASRVVLVIGGSMGLSGEVLQRANARLSLSALTFPHGLCRVLLLEQLFRAMKIRAGEAYHK